MKALFTAAALSLLLSQTALADDQAAFQAAIKDAETATGADVDTTLFNIAPWNKQLIRDGSGRVLVLSYMSNSKVGATWPVATQPPMPGTDGTAPEKRDIWVTAAPQLHAFCSKTGLKGEALARRIKQYLGLSTSWTYDGLVEMWVDAKDLYRPCPDPEINDRTCELSEAVQGHYAETVNADYRSWFNWMLGRSYGPDGAPWTRLGYTYDWGDDNKNHRGASEYIIAEGASVTFHKMSSPDAYCAVQP